MVTELEKVFLVSLLPGNLELDIKNIKISNTINLNDMRIYGIKGKFEEINGSYRPFTLLCFDLESLYKP